MHPVLFELPWGGTANAYGTLILLGGLLAMPGIAWDAQRRGVAPGNLVSFVVDFYLVLVFGAAIGGRVLHIVTMPAAYLAEPSKVFALDDSGFVFFGSLLAILLGFAILARRYSTSFGTLCDIAATFMGLGHAFGRLGCYFAGCCWGAPTDAWSAVRFPSESVVYALEGAPIAGDHTIGLHPVQIYEAAGLLGLFAVLFVVRVVAGPEPRWRQASRYAIGYGALRFVTEMFRGDASRGLLLELRWPELASALALPSDQALALSVSQLIALGLVVLGAIGWRRSQAPASDSIA